MAPSYDGIAFSQHFALRFAPWRGNSLSHVHMVIGGKSSILVALALALSALLSFHSSMHSFVHCQLESAKAQVLVIRIKVLFFLPLHPSCFIPKIMRSSLNPHSEVELSFSAGLIQIVLIYLSLMTIKEFLFIFFPRSPWLHRPRSPNINSTAVLR